MAERAKSTAQVQRRTVWRLTAAAAAAPPGWDVLLRERDSERLCLDRDSGSFAHVNNKTTLIRTQHITDSAMRALRVPPHLSAGTRAGASSLAAPLTKDSDQTRYAGTTLKRHHHQRRKHFSARPGSEEKNWMGSRRNQGGTC